MFGQLHCADEHVPFLQEQPTAIADSPRSLDSRHRSQNRLRRTKCTGACVGAFGRLVSRQHFKMTALGRALATGFNSGGENMMRQAHGSDSFNRKGRFERRWHQTLMRTLLAMQQAGRP